MATEICELEHGRHLLGQLQWGRRLMATEIASTGRVPHFYATLQWGRRLMATEIKRFENDLINGVQSLQWGRRLMATEIQEHLLVARGERRASMGPSSDGDGNRPGPRRPRAPPGCFNGAVV